MEPVTIAWGTAGLVGIAAFGKWLVPLLGRIFETATTNAEASGGLVKTLTAERDHWKEHALRLDASLQALRDSFRELQSEFDIMKYQLQEALSELRKHREASYEPSIKLAEDGREPGA